MTEREFAYWLQGFFEISDASTLDATKVQIIKDHLALVFNKVTPTRNFKELYPFPANNDVVCSDYKDMQFCAKLPNDQITVPLYEVSMIGVASC